MTKIYVFITLSMKTDKKINQKASEIHIFSIFKYVGEEDIHFDKQPFIYLVIQNYGNGKIDKVIAFNNTKPKMKKGGSFSQTINGLNLGKGKHEAYIYTTIFSIGSSQYKLNTIPIIFEVKS